MVTCSQDVGHFTTHDSGIAWNSLAYDWIKENLVISDRDNNLPKFSEFSPTLTMSNP